MKWDWGLDGHNYSNYHNILSTHASSLAPVFFRYLEKKPFESILWHCNFLNFYAQLLLIRALCQFIDRRHFEARKFPTVNWLNLLNFSQHNLATCKSQKNHFFFKFSFYTPSKLLNVFINDKNKNKLKVTSQVFLSCVTNLHYIFLHIFSFQWLFQLNIKQKVVCEFFEFKPLAPKIIG